MSVNHGIDQIQDQNGNGDYDRILSLGYKGYDQADKSNGHAGIFRLVFGYIFWDDPFFFGMIGMYHVKGLSFDNLPFKERIIKKQNFCVKFNNIYQPGGSLSSHPSFFLDKNPQDFCSLI